MYGSFAKNNHGTSPVGKRRLIRAGGSGTRISNTCRPPDPGGGALSTVSCARTSAWTLPPKGPRDCPWTPDEQTYPPLGREPFEWSMHPSVSHRLNYRPDRPPKGVVKASTIATLEPVGGTVPTGAVDATRDTGRALPWRRQKTSKEDLHTNRVILSDLADTVAVGAIPLADLAGNVAIGVASPANLAGIVTAGVASSADLAGDATVGVASSADLAGDATVGVVSPAVAEVASSADLAGVVSSADIAEVASSADLAEVVSSADLASFVTRWNAGAAFWSQVTVIAFVMILLRWRPLPDVLSGSRLVRCLRPIQIVLLLLIGRMRNNVRSVVGHRGVSDCYRPIRTRCLVSRRLLWWVPLARELPGS